MTCTPAPATPALAGPATPESATSTIADVIAAHPQRFAAVRLDPAAGDSGIVLAHQDGFADLLHESGIQSRQPLDRAATAITDPAQVRVLLRAGLRHSREQLRDEQHRAAGQRIAYETTLREIRDYAVARYKDGDICRDGLDAFLKHFELDAYEPMIRVRFTITGSYLVRGTRDLTEQMAERDGRDFIRVDLSRVDDVVDDSGDFTVEIDSAVELTDDE